jgi:hypothetical protein
VLSLPNSLPEEKIRWVKGIVDFGRLSEFLSSLTPRTLVWSATAAAVAILVPAAVIIAVVVKEQGGLSGQSNISSQFASRESKTDALPRSGFAVFASPPSVESPPVLPPIAPTRKLSDEEIADPVGRGRRLIAAGDISNARLVLQPAAEAGNATAALELGATYDPFELRKFGAPAEPSGASFYAARPAKVDAARPAEVYAARPSEVMARTWYQRAKDLGSPEAAGRLERLSQKEGPPR